MKTIRSLPHDRTRSAHIACWVARAVLAWSLTCAARVHADAASEARAHYARAIRFYDDGAYDAALVELTRAYELNPSYRLMYNIGQARLAMRDYAGAIDAYQRYLRDGGSQIAANRVASVRAQLNDLQQRVGKLVVETDVPDSEVLVDDVVVGTAPLSAAVTVNAGMRRITVRHPDYPTHSQRIGVAAGEQHHVALPLRPRQADSSSAAHTPNEAQPLEPTPSAPPVAPERGRAPDIAPLRAAETQASPPDDEPDRTLTYVGTGVTVALAAAAVVLGVVTLSRNSDLKARRNRPDVDVSAFDDDRSAMRTMANVTDVIGIAALAVGGVTTWLWLRDPGPSAERTASSGLRVGVAGMTASF